MKTKLSPFQIIESDIDSENVIYKSCNFEFSVYDKSDEKKYKKLSLIFLIIWSIWYSIILVGMLEDIISKEPINFIFVINLLIVIFGFSLIKDRVIIFDGVRTSNTINANCIVIKPNPKRIIDSINNPDGNDYEEFSSYVVKFMKKHFSSSIFRKQFGFPIKHNDGENILMLFIDKNDYRYISSFKSVYKEKVSWIDSLANYAKNSSEVDNTLSILNKEYTELQSNYFNKLLDNAIYSEDISVLEDFCKKFELDVERILLLRSMSSVLEVLDSLCKDKTSADDCISFLAKVNENLNTKKGRFNNETTSENQET